MNAMTAAEANRNFSALLRLVREGRSCTITSHGKPIARLVPVTARDVVRRAAKRTLLDRLRSQPVTTPIARWTRNELYDE